MMLDHAEIAKRIENMVKVTRQQVILAKRFFLEKYSKDMSFTGGETYSTQSMVEALLQSENAIMPMEIIIQDEGGVISKTTEKMMKSAAESISWTLAGCEAIWGLFSANLLFPSKESPSLVNLVVTPQFSQRGHSGPLYFKKSSFRVIEAVQFSRTIIFEDQVLSDPDLFLYNLVIPSIHSEVEEAIRESVRCFRHELYLASLTMLGRATEGAWIEAGMKLASNVQSGDTLKCFLQNKYKGIGEKIDRIRKFYNGTDTEFRIKLGVSVQDLDVVAVWSDVVRDSRNSIHYGAVSSMPNTYEKIAALLIGAVPYISILYKLFDGMA